MMDNNKVLHFVIQMWVDEVKPLLEELEGREFRRNNRDRAEYIKEITERFDINLQDTIPRLFKCSVNGCVNEAVDQEPNNQPSVCSMHDTGR